MATLTQAQVDYITARTNERGSTHTPHYVFGDTSLISDTQLHIGAITDDGGYHAGMAHAPNGDWLTNPDQSTFDDVVEKAITGCERHM